MTKFIPFDPELHEEGIELFELQSKESDGDIVTEIVLSESDYAEAAATPWYFLVEEG